MHRSSSPPSARKRPNHALLFVPRRARGASSPRRRTAARTKISSLLAYPFSPRLWDCLKIKDMQDFPRARGFPRKKRGALIGCPGIFDAESCRCGKKTMFIIFQISLGKQREQCPFEHFRFHRTLQGIPFCAKIQVFSGDGCLRRERPRAARRSRRRRAPLFRPLHRAYYSPPHGGRTCQVGRRK